jgi:hypothetical protein
VLSLNVRKQSNLCAMGAIHLGIRARLHVPELRHPDASQPFPDKKHAICFMVAAPGKSALLRRSARPVGNSMQKESTPLWVWLSAALLAIGTVAYITTVYFVEYIVALF